MTRKMLGRKTGSGFYKYEGKQQTPNEAIEKWRKLRTMPQATIGGRRLCPDRLVFPDGE